MKVFNKIVYAFLLFLMLMLLALWLFKPRGATLNDWNMGTEDNKNQISLPISFQVPESKVYTFKTHFKKTSYNTLVIPEINGHAFKVFINNQLVGGVGDFNHPTANIWNYVHTINFSQVTQNELNELRIDIYGLHDVGINQAPYLANNTEIQPYVLLQNIFISESINWVIGAAFTFAILLLLLSIHSDINKKIYLFYAIALFLFSIYSTDLTYRETTGSLAFYLIIRKIQMLSLFLSASFMVIAARYYFTRQKIPSLAIIIILLILSPILFAPSYIVLNNITQYIGLLLIVSLIYLIIINFMDPNKRTLFSTVFLCLAVLYRFFEYIYDLPPIFVVQYAVLIYILGVIYMIIADYSLLKEEKTRLNEKVKHDHLTKVYNRTALEFLTISNGDAVIFIDIDNFKHYNDTLGHSAGDQLLIKFANFLSLMIRSQGDLVRYGGDEFVIILYNHSVTEATVLIEKLRNDIKDLFVEIDLSYGVTEFKDNLFDSLIHADRKMYEMKFMKENTNSH
ncbi:GGDEF domain-containing protein [Haloplasma contractile]|uniref:Diguanylate cyclase protein n=1 Tax=Haloplasma contractile SSD-17B TaxID=1033810 RepID=F7Q0U9_9MOLU|nr:GGDEF domain-containing protein [Haloplasma contractile]ERJ11322.1 diguanylate cyclase protein [Haloplasma contractile SSD-17B]